MAAKKFRIRTDGLKLNRDRIIYLREGAEVDVNSRIYRGQPIVRVPGEKLDRAYQILQTITDQHLPKFEEYCVRSLTLRKVAVRTNGVAQ